MPKKVDISGRQFGRWVVLHEAGRSNAGKVMWLCRCACGKKERVAGGDLRSGRTKGCKPCSARDKATTHGETKTKLHYTWLRMKDRCYNRNSADYKHYGERGISVCAEWRDTYIAFRDWSLENGYVEGLEIDRIDNNGNYCPENCRWATRRQQTQNTRRNVLIEINGDIKCRAEWARESGLNVNMIARRQQRGLRGEDLLSPSCSARALR